MKITELDCDRTRVRREILTGFGASTGFEPAEVYCGTEHRVAGGFSALLEAVDEEDRELLDEPLTGRSAREWLAEVLCEAAYHDRLPDSPDEYGQSDLLGYYDVSLYQEPGQGPPVEFHVTAVTREGGERIRVAGRFNLCWIDPPDEDEDYYGY